MGGGAARGGECEWEPEEVPGRKRGSLPSGAWARPFPLADVEPLVGGGGTGRARSVSRVPEATGAALRVERRTEEDPAAADREPAGLEGVSAAFAREMRAAREADADWGAEAGDFGDFPLFFLSAPHKSRRMFLGMSILSAEYW